MRQLTLALAACFVGACASVRTEPAKPSTQQLAACEAAEGPLIIVDGVIQERSCDNEKPQSALQCTAGAVVYVIDGVRSCAKP